MPVNDKGQYVDAHALAIEEDVERQKDEARAENPENETRIDKRDVENDKAFEDPSLNPAIVPGDDEDVETADEDASEVEER